MNRVTAVFAAAALSLTAGLTQARDLGPDEALKLRDAGIIQSLDKLEAVALAAHAGGTVEEAELEEAYGRYVYQAEVRDAQGVPWAVELDATNGQILKNQQDD